MMSSAVTATLVRLKSKTDSHDSRYEREAELRDQLEGQYDSKKVDWSERSRVRIPIS